MDRHMESALSTMAGLAWEEEALAADLDPGSWSRGWTEGLVYGRRSSLRLIREALARQAREAGR